MWQPPLYLCLVLLHHSRTWTGGGGGGGKEEEHGLEKSDYGNHYHTTISFRKEQRDASAAPVPLVTHPVHCSALSELS